MENLSRTKSLIKPAPNRSSWELLLKDYLEDQNYKKHQSQLKTESFQTIVHESRAQMMANRSPSRELFSSVDHFQREGKREIPPRRYQITLEELVFLISQVGRVDFYREIVDFIEQQNLTLFSGSNEIERNLPQ